MRAGETAQPAVQAASSPGVLVGVVRGDGMLVPLALHRPQAELWEPLSGNAAAGGIRILDAAALPARQWTFHPGDGASPRPLAIFDRQTLPVYCERQEVLATDALPAGSPGRVRPPLGFATNGNLEVLPVGDVLAQPDDASRQAAAFIVQMTHGLEAGLAAQPSSRLAAISTAQRQRAQVVITLLRRVRTNGDDSYYFEAHKQYGRIHPYARGWIYSSRTRISLLGVSAGVDSGGESGRPQGRVLGAVRYGRAAWIMETEGYEGSYYELVDMTLPGHFVNVPGGGC
jgi:hypothetical protein